MYSVARTMVACSLTIVGGVCDAPVGWRLGAERLCALGAMGHFWAAAQLHR